jgi:ketosteroid isomerase-like protein
MTRTSMTNAGAALAAGALALTAGAAKAADDRATVAALDVAYQAAVKANDHAAMERILHPQMILVVGSGTVITRNDLIGAAKTRAVVYQIQDEAPASQTVRMYGPDTAIVTARLRIKSVADGKLADRTLWFSDTYVRTAQGWRYAFGQASLALP